MSSSPKSRPSTSKDIEGDAPRELHLSLRAWACCPADRPPLPLKVGCLPLGSSLEVYCPSSASSSKRPPTRLCLSRFVPTAPFLTTSPACSAPNPPGISPGTAHGVPALQGDSRPAVRPAVSSGPSPHDLASAAPAVASGCLSGPPSSEELFDLTTSVGLQGVSRRVDRIRPRLVSRPRGTDPLMGFLVGTSLPVADQVSSSASGFPAASASTSPPSPSEDSRVAPSHGRPFGPVTIPE